jgi:leucyl-tRNA synthetase
MAYYCIAHILQGGVIDGSSVGIIKPEQLTYEVWLLFSLGTRLFILSRTYIFYKVFEYIYGEDDVPIATQTGIPAEILEKCRKEFRSFYPVKLRVSGKDLIPNHLVFWIYNHVALFPKVFSVIFYRKNLIFFLRNSGQPE